MKNKHTLKKRVPIITTIPSSSTTIPKLNMKNRIPIITTCLVGAGLLAVATFVTVGQNNLAAQSPPDQAHAAHVAAAANQAGGQTVEGQLSEMLARIEQLEARTQQQGPSASGNTMPMGAGNPPRIRPMPDMGMTGGGKGAMGGGSALTDQMAELRAKMQRLELAMQRQSGVSPGSMPMSGTSGQGMGTRPMPGGMAGMGGAGAPGTMTPAGGMSGMGGGGPSPGGAMGMMGMMDKMMGMMDKMMGGGAMPGGAPIGGASPAGGMGGGMMAMDKMEMGAMGGMGGGASGGSSGSGSSGGGGMGMMDMDKMEMAGMMGGMGGTGGTSMAMPSALPGFPGASHLYHIGATGFFLDHPQHITLSTEQQMLLNQAREKAGLDKASVKRSVQQAEQDLWTLTAADQPDNAQIEAKIAEIGKLKCDGRLRFIGAVGEAGKILNDEQRRILTGFSPPAPAAAAAAAPMAGGMKDM